MAHAQACSVIVVFRHAGKSGDPAKIDSVTITPDPPVKGKDVTVKATFTLSM